MLHQSCLLHHENSMPLRASPALEHHWVNYLGSVILLKITGPFWDQKLVIFNTTPKSLRENHLEISWCGQNGSNVLATSLNLVSHVLNMYVEKKNVQIDQFTKEQNIWLEWKNPATLCCPHLVLLYQVICCFCIQSLPGWQLIPLPSAGEIESMNQYLRCHGNSTASEHWSMYGIWSYWKNDDFP